MPSFLRTDQLLSNTSVSVDEETLLQLFPDEQEESSYPSGSTDYTPSDYEGLLRLNETEAAVAGIPQQPLRSLSSCGSGNLYSSIQSALHSQPNSNNMASGNSFVSCRGSMPQQVEDDDCQLNWNPVADVMHRIQSKVKFLQKSGFEFDVIPLLVEAEGICSSYKNFELIITGISLSRECRMLLLMVDVHCRWQKAAVDM